MKSSKKIGILLIASILTVGFISNSEAQVIPTFGVKGGLNYSTLNNADDVEYKSGVLIGAYTNLKIPLSPISIQPEILYAQYGANIEDSDASIKLNYIQVPVLIKFGFPAPGATPNVYFGPYANFLLNSKVENDTGSINLEDNTKSSTFGVIVGVGVDISKIQLGLRYTAGLTNVADDAFNDEAKNGAFGVTLGVSF